MINRNEITPTEEKRIYDEVLRTDNHLPNISYELWLSENAKRQEKDEFIRNIWNDPQFTEALTILENQTSGEVNKDSSRSSKFRYPYALSAACFFICVLAIGLIRPSFVQDVNVNTQIFETTLQEIQHNELIDGSIADLSAKTRLNVHFSESERRLQLWQGEAQFSVKKDADRPFVVETNHARMEALGTIFNVDQRGDVTELSVFEGQVAISPLNDLLQKNVISAGERVIVSAGGSHDIIKFDVNNHKSWTAGWISVEKMPLSELLIKLNRFSQIELKNGDITTGRLLVTGSFELKEMDKNIRILEALHSLEVIRQHNQITLQTRS
jgi:transmembrane sensor